jgi:PhzF family phenazine biosynthesis protein
MKIQFYQVDAFASNVFSGNPAAVCLLGEWLGDEVLQGIAAENNLSETAFLVKRGAYFDLRWFTPAVEVALCGHATLASAYVLYQHFGWPEASVRFKTRHAGELLVARRNDLYEMDFPARPVHGIDSPEDIFRALGVSGGKGYGSVEDILVVLDNERAVRELVPDMAKLGGIECRGVIVTAPGEGVDFVSRFFAPRVGVSEDPVTGSAHCVLIPYWAAVLEKNELTALQVSNRGGEIFGRNGGDRVYISGKAVLYAEGTIYI